MNRIIAKILGAILFATLITGCYDGGGYYGGGGGGYYGGGGGYYGGSSVYTTNVYRGYGGYHDYRQGAFGVYAPAHDTWAASSRGRTSYGGGWHGASEGTVHASGGGHASSGGHGGGGHGN